ncbi:RNA-binding cell elongation regulator Jag/EloR [Maridesulfovibrio sp.]|uniref:RNA-binding cell elongation regulator Jag/EloR n=1 Tax=Maridesulfovibrio sp. TaxID=2795000 RepID=UPI002A18DE4C|nr:RNA-binding cell elongation regulator Jag/EloR [Maridesulfovibrio sp.]
MSEFMEFQGKNLDEAINNACDHFSLNRDKLEIEIISGGSTGVFGLVGKKNAKVKARPRGGDSRSALNDDSRRGRGHQQRREQPEKRQSRPKSDRRREEQVPVANEEDNSPAPRIEPEVPAVKPEAEVAVKEQGEVAIKPESEVAVREEALAPAVADMSDDGYDEEFEERDDHREPRSIMEGDPEEIAAAVREALETMIEPIIQDKPKLEIEVGEDRVNVLVDDEENSGLIIGREGQTLSSLQYLCNRMVSKKLQTSVRVQIDTGDYRERQDEKLRQLAWHLADKAMHTGRVQSTKPLSSYHRRVVHMALQEDKHVNTRSKGEGPMKRVLILPRRSRSGGGTGGRRNDNYGRGNDRYDSRSNDRSRGRRDRNDRTEHTDRNDRTERNDNYRGRRNERTDRTERNDNYRGRNDRNDNYNRGRRNERIDNYNKRNDNYSQERDENFGNREEFNRPAPFDNGYSNRYQDDNFGNRQSRYNNNRRNDRNKEGNSTNYNSERYNRY